LKKKLAETEVIAQTLQDARPRLDTLLVLARAYRSVERVEMTLDALRGLGGQTEVAMVADSIYQRFDEAQARLDAIHQAQDLDIQIELEQAEAEDQLAERRRRLGLAPEPEEVAPPPKTLSPEQPPNEPEPTPDEPTPPPEEPASPPESPVD
jgi:hypothetical protein